MVKMIYKFRTRLFGCLLLALCSGGAAADEALLSGGQIGEILADSRMIVVNGTYYYADRQIPINAEWSKVPVKLEQLKPGMDVTMQISPESAGSSLPHITEMWVYWN